MRGRKPKPTKLKILGGNAGKRTLPDEPEAVSGTPDVPDFLGDAARAHWTYFADLLDAVGLLAMVDRMSFAALCRACADYERTCKLLDATAEFAMLPNGEVMTELGSPVISPAWVSLRAALVQAERRMHSWSSEFGLTPAVRASMGVTGGAKESDPFEAFLNGKKKSG